MEGTVRHAGYRSNCLESNNIHIQDPSIPLLPAIKLHWTRLSHLAPKTPKPPPDTVALAISELEKLGLECTEPKVVGFLGKHIFPGVWGGPLAQGLASRAAAPMDRHLLPRHPAAQSQVQQPWPDILYGYSEAAFTPEQRQTLKPLYPKAPFNLLLPFLAVECKAAAGTGGSLWAATNQCAGASTACLQAAAYLNTALTDVGRNASRVSNVCHSVAVDNHLAFLYVSWMDDEGHFYMQRVDFFCLLRPHDFVRFQQHIQAILKWGAETRLDGLRSALDEIAKARREEETEDKDEPKRKRRRMGAWAR
ncbi:hypothetical protein QBC40DRAFT_187543 [Triangularia verruculosa]|uniref:DUF7924 domain-containing protein n=1 Tax=Triangularia verruculosa TaxID=2587418 RepID=A0AAN7AR71_9PEZI|nr:hypothetical protein QBC40DRAFT_187543 [Triangularia verruculosa]